MTFGRRRVFAAMAALDVAAILVLLPSRAVADTEPLVATPPPGSISVRVGDELQFSVTAPGATGVTWTLWDRAVSRETAWTYVPGPEDAGWQQVVLTVRGPGDLQRERVWDVGIVPAVAPEIIQLQPAPGSVSVEVADVTQFLCSARVRAARTTDRLQFEWLMDGTSVQRDEQSAVGGTSELSLPATGPGSHRIAVRVSEDQRTAAIGEWTLDVLPSRKPVPTPDVGPSPNPPPPSKPAPRVVAPPGPHALRRDLGQPVVLKVGIEPEEPGVSFTWTVDGVSVQRGPEAQLDWSGTSAGLHRVVVTANVEGRAIGSRSWMITVTEPSAPAVSTEQQLAAVPPPALVPARPPSLAEDEVRRWLEEYARAWSRRDMDALRKMGQVHSAGEEERLQRYFESIRDLHVEVHVRAVAIHGNHASVEFERIDTVTDPSGRQQELRLPPLRKEIERTSTGLRFADHAG